MYEAMFSGFISLKTILVFIDYFITVKMIYQLDANDFFKYFTESVE